MIYAMFFMFLLTLWVALLAVRTRVISVKTGQIQVKYFKTMQGRDVPESIVKTTRCFNNLFEIPIVFYVVCTLYISLNIQSYVALSIAWLFVFLRCFQAYIHITYNNVRHRMFAFGMSFLCVFLLWVNLILLRI